MCDFKQLSSGSEGFVLRCIHCGIFQIAFGGTMMSLHLEAFHQFKKLADHLSQRSLYADSRHSRCLVIPTPYYGVNLLLQKDELDKLKTLLSAAEDERIVQSMLALFS